MLPTRLNVRLPPAFMSASNFSFLVSHSPLLAELGATAAYAGRHAIRAAR